MRLFQKFHLNKFYQNNFFNTIRNFDVISEVSCFSLKRRVLRAKNLTLHFGSPLGFRALWRRILDALKSFLLFLSLKRAGRWLMPFPACSSFQARFKVSTSYFFSHVSEAESAARRRRLTSTLPSTWRQDADWQRQ